MSRPGFVFDLNRCTGCQACVVACWMEHRERQTRPWREVHAANAFHNPALPGYHLSLACHHCEHPACLAQCPVGAYDRDEATGAVLVHAERCMGCRYCTWACPHDAPKFAPENGTVEKCTFCHERLAQGLEPACVARCPVEALGLDAERPAAPFQDVPGLPASGLKPGIRLVGLRRPAPPDTAPLPPGEAFLEALLPRVPRKITLKGEWTLVVFTTVLSALAAWTAAAWLQGRAFHPLLFLGLGGGAMALSAWHLGHPERAWRAVLNFRSSWLSREIALVSAFLGLGAAYGFGVKALGPVAALAGFAALATVDQLYRVARMGRHSALALLNGLYLLGWLLPWWPLAAGAGLLKAGLYLARKRGTHGLGRGLVSGIRILAGFVAPWLLPAPAAAAAALLGDLVDRCEYYDELRIPSPAGELEAYLRKILGITA